MSNDLVQADTTIVTAPVEETSDFSPPQAAALDALLSGKTATDAAAAAGVSRRTVYNWLHKDFRFQAALNRRHRDLRQAIGCRVEQMAADATDCVARAVRDGNVKAAMEILKSLRLLVPPTIGSDDELLLQIEQKERTRERDTKIALAGFRDMPLLTGKK
jgi:hypothetical protein